VHFCIQLLHVSRPNPARGATAEAAAVATAGPFSATAAVRQQLRSATTDPLPSVRAMLRRSPREGTSNIHQHTHSTSCLSRVWFKVPASVGVLWCRWFCLGRFRRIGRNAISALTSVRSLSSISRQTSTPCRRLRPSMMSIFFAQV
jgi:hypothetical protein